MTNTNNQLHECQCCGAKTRSGSPCKKFAMPNGRCMLHGGKTPTKHPNYNGHMNALKHGKYKAEVKVIKREMSKYLKFIDGMQVDNATI